MMPRMLCSMYPPGARGPGGGENRYRLFELDVKKMFPHLPRAGVLDAVRNIAAAVMRALKGRQWGG